MIVFDFLTTADGKLTGFRGAGHSGFSEQGTDIVCAAASSAVFMAINTITDVINVEPLALRMEENESFFRIEEKDYERCSVVLIGLKIHLQNLEEQYPEFISVSYMEV